jgi:hypothetical protein
LGVTLGDLTLKEGTKIHVASKFKKDKSAGVEKKTGINNFVLAPPPEAGSTVFSKVASPTVSVVSTLGESATPPFVNGNDDFDDDDFGDFEG